MSEKRPATLQDSVDLMLSDDYKKRFKAEYMQLAIRHGKLATMLRNYVAGKLDFEPTTDYGLLYKQCQLMDEYLMILRVRARLEGIEL